MKKTVIGLVLIILVLLSLAGYMFIVKQKQEHAFSDSIIIFTDRLIYLR